MKPPAAARSKIDAIIERVNSLSYEITWIETAIIEVAREQLDTVTNHDLRHRIAALRDAVQLLDLTLRQILRGQGGQ
jgi:hypothetical protein